MCTPSILESSVMLMRSILALIFLAVATPSLSHASLTLSVGDLALTPGQIGSIDVTVEGTGDLVSFAGFEFVIVPESPTTSTLRFVEEDEAYLADPGYVFFGNSAAKDDGIASSVGTVSTSSLPDDTFVGGDGTADFADVSISGSMLLASLRVEHDFGAADPSTTVGHKFSVALVPVSGDSNDFAQGASNTGFLDSQFGSVSFTSTPGTVTIFIPEPSSLFLAAIGLLGVVLRARRHRRD